MQIIKYIFRSNKRSNITNICKWRQKRIIKQSSTLNNNINNLQLNQQEINLVNHIEGDIIYENKFTLRYSNC